MFKEDNLQIAVANYLRYQYPNILFAHIANERKTTHQQGARLKQKGVKSGMPDIMVFKQNTSDNTGLAIELKIKPNKPTPSQLTVLGQLKDEGWQTHIAYSFDEAKEVIDKYLIKS